MYNEEAGAATCVRAVCHELAQLPNRTALIVVEDGGRDRTAEILTALEREEDRLTVVRHPRNLGYGAALKSGARRAYNDGFDYALFMDSDLTNDPRDIPRFAAAMESGADVLKATRYSRGGSVAGVPAYRVWISRFGNAVARMLFALPVHDCTNGFRAVRTHLLAGMDLRENRFPIIMEELYWLKFLGAKCDEIPVTLTNRSEHQRPTSFVYTPRVFWQYLKYPVRAFLRVAPETLEEK
jgi:glycosyltransferase involved in cell wall biosynthesis